jgi:hypothetical protein
MEEFFKQGDREKEKGLDFSPLCDRYAKYQGGAAKRRLLSRMISIALLRIVLLDLVDFRK